MMIPAPKEITYYWEEEGNETNERGICAGRQLLSQGGKRGPASPQKGRLKAESEPQGGIWKNSILGGGNSNCKIPKAEVG